MKSIKHWLVLGAAVFILASCGEKQIKVACIGDSITEGYGLACQSATAYPVILNQILGSQYQVLNSGRSATTLQKKADFPFWICKEFYNVFAFQPDIITIKLGTNDTKYHNWNEERYEADYQALIDTLNTIPTHPKIYLCKPVPVYETTWDINDSTVINGVMPVIDRLAAKNGLAVIDLYTPMLNKKEMFPDNIHPNEAGMVDIANVIAKAIK